MTAARPTAVVLTSDQRRHRYAVNALSEAFEIRGVVAEAKTPAGGGEALSDADAATLREHFGAQRAAEERILGDPGFPPEVEVLPLQRGAVGSPEVFDWVTRRGPDVVILYGTSIIRPPLLDHYEGRMVNLHLGLSPYYRGSGTNFWPLVDRLPECVGATIHLAVLKVDAGAVLTQVRPSVEPGDAAHELGTKTIVAGLEAMKRAIPAFLAGGLEPVEQPTGVGKVFRRRDFGAEAVRRMWQNLESGMIAEYLDDPDGRRSRFPIVERV